MIQLLKWVICYIKHLSNYKYFAVLSRFTNHFLKKKQQKQTEILLQYLSPFAITRLGKYSMY